MNDAWSILDRGGLPIASATAGPTPSRGELADAAARVIDEGSGSQRDREALAAWLLGWRAQWPGSFEEAFGARAAVAARWAEAAVLDRNRYLKLRRIAIERLIGVA